MQSSIECLIKKLREGLRFHPNPEGWGLLASSFPILRVKNILTWLKSGGHAFAFVAYVEGQPEVVARLNSRHLVCDPESPGHVHVAAEGERILPQFHRVGQAQEGFAVRQAHDLARSDVVGRGAPVLDRHGIFGRIGGHLQQGCHGIHEGTIIHCGVFGQGPSNRCEHGHEGQSESLSHHDISPIHHYARLSI